jgi:hypothetical protein
MVFPRIITKRQKKERKRKKVKEMEGERWKVGDRGLKK